MPHLSRHIWSYSYTKNDDNLSLVSDVWQEIAREEEIAGKIWVDFLSCFVCLTYLGRGYVSDIPRSVCFDSKIWTFRCQHFPLLSTEIPSFCNLFSFIARFIFLESRFFVSILEKEKLEWMYLPEDIHKFVISSSECSIFFVFYLEIP